MEFRAVPNRVNQPPLQEKFGANTIALLQRFSPLAFISVSGHGTRRVRARSILCPSTLTWTRKFVFKPGFKVPVPGLSPTRKFFLEY